MNRDRLDDAVKNLLSTIMNEGPVPIQVGESDVPSETPTVPYLILFQSPSPRPEGSMGNPEDMRYFDYHVKSVGRNHRETTRVSSQVQDCLVGRSQHGYLHDLEAGGFSIVSRSSISEGIVAKSSGPNLFEKDDIYRICATASD